MKTGCPTKILHIEDSAIQQEVVRSVFARIGVFPAFTAVSTLSEGMSIIQSSAFDVVILDLGLPDTSGGISTWKTWYECCPNTPTVIFTADENQNLAKACIAAGAQDYVYKSEMEMLPRICVYAIERWRYSKKLREKEAEVRRLHLLYKNILDVSPEIIIRYTPDYKITYANKAAVCLMNGAEDLIGRRIDEFLTPKHVDMLPARLAAITVDNPVAPPNEQPLDSMWISWVVSGIFNDDGTIAEYQSMGRDVTYKYMETTEAIMYLSKKLDDLNKKTTTNYSSLMKLASNINEMLETRIGGKE